MKLSVASLVAVLGLATALPAAAQPLAQRDARQATRIAEGEASGALTPHEAYRLRMQEHQLRMRIWRMKARHHGRVTPQERRALRRAEARHSEMIWALKHNQRRSR